jgi:hypothetical protein
LEELKGDKKLEPPLPKFSEEDRELEYQQMIDKLNNTLSAALAEVKKKKKKKKIVGYLRKGSPMQHYQSDWTSICIICLYCILVTSNIIAVRYLISK